MTSPNLTTCLSPACVEASKVFLQNLHPDYHGINPCKEWDKFVCGGFRERHILRPNSAHNSTLSQITEGIESALHDILTSSYEDAVSNHALYPFAPAGSGHVRDFDTVEIRLDQENFDTVADYYGTCLKSEAIEPNGDAAFHELMEKVHKSFKNLDEVTKIPQKSGPDIVNPVVDSKEFVPHTYSSRVADALTNLSPYGIFAFFKYEVVPSYRNPNNPIVSVSPFAETGMIMQSNYGKPDLVEHYHYLLISFLKRAHSGVESGHKDFDLIAKNIIKMESELHQTMSIPFSDLYPEGNYEYMSLDDLDNELSAIDLSGSIRNSSWVIMPGAAADMLEVEVRHFQWFSKLTWIFRYTEKETIRSFLLWQAFLQTQHLWDMPWLVEWREFRPMLEGKQDLEPRKTKCLQRVNRHFGHTVDSFFVRTQLMRDSKKNSDPIIQDIHTAYKAIVRETGWMAPTTNGLLMEKLNKLKYMTDYSKSEPDITSPKSLRGYYHGAELRFGTNTKEFEEHTGNTTLERPRKWTLWHDYMRLEQWHTNKTWTRLSEHVNPDMWRVPAHSITPYHSYGQNQLVLPAGLMRYPLYHPDFPSVVNYAGYGTIVGREVSNAINTRGHKYQSNGRVGDYGWTDADMLTYHSKLGCFTSRYDDLKVEFCQKNNRPKYARLNGHMVTNEVVSDTMGADAAWLAWKLRQRRDEQKSTSTQLPGLGEFTDDQVFWILRSQLYCSVDNSRHVERQLKEGPAPPDKVRTWMPVMDSVAWRKSFQCEMKQKPCRLFGNVAGEDQKKKKKKPKKGRKGGPKVPEW